MTKKDYVRIAKEIKKAIEFEGNIERVNPAIEHLVDGLIVSLQLDNPAFDENRFKQAIYEQIQTGQLSGCHNSSTNKNKRIIK